MKNTPDWEEFYRAFPANEKYIWLNNCGTTPASRFVQEAMQDFFAEYASHGVLAPHYGYLQVKTEIQAILGRLLHTQGENIALVHNTAEGMNLISYGLELQPGDQILLMADEYPSNVYPWQHWQEKGVELITLPQVLGSEAWLHRFEETLNPKIRVVALSAVHWCTGMVLPIQEAAVLCRERDILLVVDGAQGVGQVPLDVDGWGIPVLAFSAWKWLLGPVGLGCLVVPREKLKQFKPVFKGTGSVVNESCFFPYRDEYKPTAERYIYSTANFNDWIYFRASLTMLESIGFEVVRQRIGELAAYLRRILKSCGFQVLPAPVASGIVVAQKPGLQTNILVKKLQQEGIIARERQGRLRLAPHIYNSPGQLEKVKDVLGG